jgi:uncharacterized protein (DUF736 family)
MDCGTLKGVTSNEIPSLKFAGEIILGRRCNGFLELHENVKAKTATKKPDTPDYIVKYKPFTWRGSFMVAGAAWLKNGASPGDFLSISMDDPDWTAPLNLAAFFQPDKSLTIVWTRPRSARTQEQMAA